MTPMRSVRVRTPALRSRARDVPGHRVVLITGASSGIGRAAAQQVSAAGDHVVLVARGEAALRATADECTAAGAASTTAITADVGDDQAVARLVDEVLLTHGTLDLVVHCAGVVAYGRTEEVPVEVFDKVLRTNLTGSVNLARHVIPVLRRQRRGDLLYVGSVIGHVAVPRMSAYVLSKWGVRALARQLRLENRDIADVHIGYVAPGGIDTPIYLQAATYIGSPGRPPPPVASPERVARVALARAGRPHARAQIGMSNDLMRFGFSALPHVFDLLVGPLFGMAAVDRVDRRPPTPGNVLSPGSGNAVHGDQGNAVFGIVRNLRATLSARAAGYRCS